MAGALKAMLLLVKAELLTQGLHIGVIVRYVIQYKVSDFVANIKLSEDRGYAVSNIDASISASELQYTKEEAFIPPFIINKINNNTIEAQKAIRRLYI